MPIIAIEKKPSDEEERITCNGGEMEITSHTRSFKEQHKFEIEGEREGGGGDIKERREKVESE